MIRFAMVGSGWRSEFYARIANALPDMFELVAWLCRSEEKAELLHKKYGVHTTLSEAEVEGLNPDFIVSAVNKTSMSDVVRYWAAKGFAVLSETPAALDTETLIQLKKEIDNGARIQVAEQYFLTPDIKAVIDACDSGIIGEPVSLTLSAMHDYHAASVIRRLLHTGLGDVWITGKAFSVSVANTKTRYETLTDGKIVNKEQKHFVMEYEDGKIAFYDFMSEQYRSPIRNRYINLRGTRGEIINDTLYFLDENNLGTVKKLTIENPFEYAGLTDGEVAVAQLLIGMKEYADTGKEVYPMDEALYDSYQSVLMDRAGRESYNTFNCSFADIC